MPGQAFTGGKPYLSIVQGTLSQKVREGAEGAELRKYELKDGTKGEKWEICYKSWEGRIVDLRIQDSNYGEMLNIEFDDAVLSINTESRYFSDFAKKIMSADINQPLTISPYDFEADGKKLIGVSIYQNEEKLKSFYWNDIDGVSCNGIPRPPKSAKEMTKDDWKIFFIEERRFLISELEKVKEKINSEPPVDESPAEEPPQEPDMEAQGGHVEDEIKVEDIPFN